MSDYNCPGVYIEEDASLALSIASGATAVPVFAHDGKLIKDPTAVRINSWLDFMTLAGSQPSETDLLYVSLKTYFENGGGYAYVCPTDKLEDQVPGHDDITLVVAAGQDVKAAVGKLCTTGETRFALLDGPQTKLEEAVPSTFMDGYDNSSYSAVYGPWLTAKWTTISIPPSAAVAGAVCTTDRERGVWKAPANIGLKGGVRPNQNVSDTVQGIYNTLEKPLNIIRAFQGTDPMIWGARTLATDTKRWRYVPVRRLFSAVEKDIRKAMRVAVFEPNSQPTWERVRSAIDNYLHSIWRQGGLMGPKPEEAYFVQIGRGVTMTDDDILQGKMIVKIGMAAVRPAEFIILQFTQDMATA
ncbi:phage tail sheath subtilisin-like domain-containing protein [Mycetohabitans sp. B2]|uniref:phage tail sheath family protein n=1 Tax=Mycetohabitans sp. B2 TaxID=2841274 RepID=UPI001F165E31|nr:phage tail sheath C-terminal domain-containing protein [Mycetohabitans sp. B2]MCF7696880.1 phage tail sheath subtilisin-like domain-containing protein [Mycetohabitans sp. B2]